MRDSLGGNTTAPSVFKARGWSIEPPAAWSLLDRPNYVTLAPPTGDAELRLGTLDPFVTHTTARQWVEAVAHFNRLKGRSVEPASCGDFRGYVVRFESEGRSFTAWALHVGDFLLDATYSCNVSLAGRDMVVLDATLGTLRFRPVAA